MYLSLYEKGFAKSGNARQGAVDKACFSAAKAAE
jgi:hypothetical protein